MTSGTSRTSHTLVVDGGYAGWRQHALRALAAGWPPQAITWDEREPTPGALPVQGSLAYSADEDVSSTGGADTSDGAGTGSAAGAGPRVRVRVSRALAVLLQDAALYRSPQRWALLYRILWRWHQGDRSVASPADADGARLHAMVKSVQRDKHDMIAYVRFHRRQADGVPEYLTWYEPEHDVLPYAADHFARRMGSTSWCIGTPRGAALWDGRTLRLSDAMADEAAIRSAAGSAAATDTVEPLWLAYYASVFNPARLNEAALHQHLPVRFWKGLPEGPLIPGLIAQARNGARRLAQADTVGAMPGKQVAVDAARALPLRAAPSALDECRRCELWRHATQAVPGSGPESARIVLVGEQPGDQEDLAGRVFVGPAGQVLDDALRRAGVPRDTVYMTNAVKHFKWLPRGKRRLHKTPAQREVDACVHWLEQELARVRPAVIVTLGATALNAILGRRVGMRDYLDAPVRLGQAWLVATWHPSYALRVDGDAAREDVVAAIARAIAQARQLAGTGPSA